MVYDESIVLSEDELSILRKGPKFAVRQEILEDEFKLELEKMVCKRKFNDSQTELDPANPSNDRTVSTNQKPGMDEFERFSQRVQEVGQTKSKQHDTHGNIVLSNSKLQWEEKRGQLVYDFETKNLNPKGH